MKIARKHYGKWVATTNKGKVVDNATTFDALMKKVDKRGDKDTLSVGLIPKNPVFIGFSSRVVKSC